MELTEISGLNDFLREWTFSQKPLNSSSSLKIDLGTFLIKMKIYENKMLMNLLDSVK